MAAIDRLCDYCDEPGTIAVTWYRSGPGFLSQWLASRRAQTGHACTDHIARLVDDMAADIRGGHR